jgi:hypothetical protein
VPNPGKRKITEAIGVMLGKRIVDLIKVRVKGYH